MESILKKYYGYTEFREYQKEVIQKILEKRDSLVVMATGSGKSLCYQVPPLLSGKTGIVISPLISLMQDQVMSLTQRGIRAEYLASSNADHSVYTKAKSGHYHLLYMTPEKACSIHTSFWSKLLELGICLVAVDEAHCISEWGHDFRVEYKKLDQLRGILLDVPFVGLTATATERVRIDIINSLKMSNPYLAVGSFDRKNLFYGVKHFNHGASSVEELVQEISKFAGSAGSTIVYCTTIKDVEQIFKSLQEAGLKAGIYHGQLGSKTREESHRSFIRDELHVMVATVAFGMGIDKPDVRQVIHYGCPKSLETYYQESGRCGRDGIASACWLYYTGSDFAKADFYCGELKEANQRRAIAESLMAAKRYCIATTCRRKFLLNYFGEKSSVDKCGNCDNCLVSRIERDMSKEAFLLMSSIFSCGGNFGLNMPIDVLRGSRAKRILDAQFDKLPLHGLGKDYSSNWWKAMANQLISHGYLSENFSDVYRIVRVSRKGMEYLNSATPDHQPPLILPLISDMVGGEELQNNSVGIENLKNLVTVECEGLSEAEGKLYHMLLEERIKLARSIGTAPYAICGDQTIKRISLTRPSTKARLANIDGVNQHLLMTYGDHLLKSIRHFSEQLNLSLDGEASMPVHTRELQSVTIQQRKLTPAKVEAWKKWDEDGLSIQMIATFPGRSASIKEQTVAEYILEAAQEGFEMDWTRFCDEIGMTSEIFLAIQGAISKVGSTDKLKPIKNELPEDITYVHIKTCLSMKKLGIPLDAICATAPHLSTSKTRELVKTDSESCSTETAGPCHIQTQDNAVAHVGSSNNEIASLAAARKQECLPTVHEEHLLYPKKRKVDLPQGISTELVASPSSLLNWLTKYDEGVSLSDIMEHFEKSEEDSVVNILSNLEGDFLIFKKNNLYRLL
ncbi:hypothetical protein K2173_016825 [Erythroxylum novogranatense]|uniref:ATP-dependent DNA helicase n=1 Tax=Erythroxylum novogranatense TaxID=1862640 RepID=A0AAV8SHU8_9ROSI|nr:hypothetical protein K2173_016825 [Erythroxylum novogranatense]